MSKEKNGVRGFLLWVLNACDGDELEKVEALIALIEKVDKSKAFEMRAKEFLSAYADQVAKSEPHV